MCYIIVRVGAPGCTQGIASCDTSLLTRHVTIALIVLLTRDSIFLLWLVQEESLKLDLLFEAIQTALRHSKLILRFISLRAHRRTRLHHYLAIIERLRSFAHLLLNHSEAVRPPTNEISLSLRALYVKNLLEALICVLKLV